MLSLYVLIYAPTKDSFAYGVGVVIDGSPLGRQEERAPYASNKSYSRHLLPAAGCDRGLLVSELKNMAGQISGKSPIDSAVSRMPIKKSVWARMAEFHAFIC
jgi:hypothetical protein